MTDTALRAVLRTLAAIALGTGALGSLGGPEREPGGERVGPSIDSEYRFAHVYWSAAGGALLWATFDLRRRRAVGAAVLALAALGGLVRLLSVARRGWPHPVFVTSLVLELAVLPVVTAWYLRATAADRP